MSVMHLKKAKKKRILNKKKFIDILYFTFVVFISYLISLKLMTSNKTNIKNDRYVDFLLKKSYDKKTNYRFIVNESLKLVSKIDLKDPTTLIDKKISNTKIENKKEEKEVYSKEDDYDSSLYDKITSYISNSNNVSDSPVLYIYNTHQLETYSNSGVESSGVTPNVMMAAYLLKEQLDKKGVKTIVEDTNMEEFIKVSGITSNKFYGSSRIFMQNAVKKYPSLKYFIDLHRDSISKDISTVTIDNKNYARVLFVIGTSNKTYKVNEEFSNKISDEINKNYPRLSRGIFKRETSNWPEAYNQDLSPNSILIELGAKDNTMEEVLNTIDALKEVLPEFMKGE